MLFSRVIPLTSLRQVEHDPWTIVRVDEVTATDEVPHHLQIAVRVAGRRASAIGRRFVLVNAMVGMRKYGKRNRLALPYKRAQPSRRFRTRCFGVIFA
jgi:hypothetical protein